MRIKVANDHREHPTNSTRQRNHRPMLDFPRKIHLLMHFEECETVPIAQSVFLHPSFKDCEIKKRHKKNLLTEMSIQTTLSFDGKLRVPRGRVKKLNSQPPPSRRTIDFLSSLARYPVFRGNPTKARRVLEIGQPYFWKGHTIPIENVPVDFRQWIQSQNLESYNSILVNIYDDEKSYIGWHSDTTKHLAKGTVVSFSFALHAEDEGKILAEMEFDKEFPTLTLRDKTRVEFDAITHGQLGVQHRVKKTIRPRINLTFRCLHV